MLGYFKDGEFRGFGAEPLTAIFRGLAWSRRRSPRWGSRGEAPLLRYRRFQLLVT